jgi:hypothetical protein
MFFQRIGEPIKQKINAINLARKRGMSDPAPKKRSTFDRYVSHSPLIKALPEVLAFTAICAAWCIIFDQALEDQFVNLFPMSTLAMSIGFIITMYTIYMNFHQCNTYFLSMSKLLNHIIVYNNTNSKLKESQLRSVISGNTAISPEDKDLHRMALRYRLLVNQEIDMSGRYKSLVIFTVYLFMFGLPWFMWGHYRWHSVWIFALISFPIFGFHRYAFSLGRDPLSDSSENYDFSANVAIAFRNTNSNIQKRTNW